MPDVCSSSGGSRACDPQTDLDTRLLQLDNAKANMKAAPGWYIMPEEETCTTSCANKGLGCTSSDWPMSEISSQTTMTDILQSGLQEGTFTCSSYGTGCHWGKPVIKVSNSKCWAGCEGYTWDNCARQWNAGFQRVCYCSAGSPTPDPTPAPPAPADLTNDPHVASLGGDRFDVNQPADYVLLRAPLEYSQPALLELRGTMEPEESKPCGLYMKAATLSGTWFGEAIVQVRPLKRNNAGSNRVGTSTVWPFSMQVSPEGSWKSLADFTAESSSEALTGMVKITAEKIEEYGELLEGQAFTFHIGKTDRPATITISQAAHQALNVEMANMQALGHQTLGGLLGTEKHSKGVEELTEACKAHRASANEWRTSRKSLEVSQMSASWL